MAMKGYYINLDERTDRREQFEQHKLPVEFERFPAKKTKPGWMGCRDTHLSLFEQIDGTTMICEDDCMFLRPWIVLKDAMQQLPGDWDLLYLGATLTVPVMKYSKNLYNLRGGYSTTGIIYHDRKVPDYMLENRDRIERLDVFIVKEIQPRFRCFIVNPMFACQRRGYSDIMHHNFDNGLRQRKRFNKYATKQTIRRKNTGFLS